MKLLIDISDEHYRNICKRAEYFGKRSIVLAPHEKAIANGIPFEDIKVEIQNTILEQTYEKGQIDELERIRKKFLWQLSNKNLQRSYQIALEELDKYTQDRIKELKENKNETSKEETDQSGKKEQT